MNVNPSIEWIKKAKEALGVQVARERPALILTIAHELQSACEQGVAQERERARQAWRAVDQSITPPPIAGQVQIWSFYHAAWWRADAAGYTSERSAAGWYEPDEAAKHCRTRTGPNAPYEVAVAPGQSINEAIRAGRSEKDETR